MNSFILGIIIQNMMQRVLHFEEHGQHLVMSSSNHSIIFDTNTGIKGICKERKKFCVKKNKHFYICIFQSVFNRIFFFLLLNVIIPFITDTMNPGT